ncbi:MAG: iron ABC transporter permease [Halieaceae bacterium]|jgi:iron complex transport system permease protein|nr:iron ABC transporter permease [Halieaceae bacterium]
MKAAALPLSLLTLLALGVLLGLAHGEVWLNPLVSGGEPWRETVLWEIRLPRVLLAVLVGGVLGMSGAALQGLLRNPLADPAIIGVSACAAFGAVLVLYTGLAGLLWFALPLGGMIGAGLSVLLVFLLTGSRSSLFSLILAGMAVNAFVGALIALVLNVASNPFAMSEMLYWLLGSFANRSLQDVAIAAPFMLTGGGLLLATGRYLDALSLAEDTAASLGFGSPRWRWLVVGGVACAVGAAVSVSGNIGFVGLVVPHLLRPFVGYQPRRLLWTSALGGALLLVLADVLVQAIGGRVELKLGVITALIGGPFFLWIILRTRSTQW